MYNIFVKYQIRNSRKTVKFWSTLLAFNSYQKNNFDWSNILLDNDFKASNIFPEIIKVKFINKNNNSKIKYIFFMIYSFWLCPSSKIYSISNLLFLYSMQFNLLLFYRLRYKTKLSLNFLELFVPTWLKYSAE